MVPSPVFNQKSHRDQTGFWLKTGLGTKSGSPGQRAIALFLGSVKVTLNKVAWSQGSSEKRNSASSTKGHLRVLLKFDLDHDLVESSGRGRGFD